MATGARLEEIGQLLVRDIKDEAGILYIHVTDLAEDDDEEAKAVKTMGSRRRVPLHNIVLAAGLRQYLDWAGRSAVRPCSRSCSGTVVARRPASSPSGTIRNS
jgi:integrase